MAPFISVRRLTFTYSDGTPALKDVSLEVFPGQKVGIIGANGAGKSTLLLHLNGLLLTEGAVEIDGVPVSKSTLKEARRRVGMVFQNPDDQLFCPTLFDDVAFGLRNMGLSGAEIERRVRDTLSRVGLNGKEKKGSFHLSFGEKRRAALATVLAMRPEALALDEPTSGLDPRGKNQIIELLNEAGGTQIIVSHDLMNLPRMVSRAVLMAEGKVIADSGIEEIIGDESLLRTAGML